MRSIAALFAFYLLLASRSASAFHDAAQFFASETVPHASVLGASSEGIYFTGAPRFARLDCKRCHSGGPERLTMHLGAAPATLFSQGYAPGTTYEIELALGNESRGLAYATPGCTEPPGPNDGYAYQPCNNNGFALEFDGGEGATPGLGTLCARAPVQGRCPTVDRYTDETVVAPGGDALFANRQHAPGRPREVLRNGATRWRFFWTAPPAGSGAVTLFAAAVDGNGGDGTAALDQDPEGDDTVRATIHIPEQGSRRLSGCRVGDPAAAATGCPWLALALVGLALAGRRRYLPCFRPRQRQSRISGMSSP